MFARTKTTLNIPANSSLYKYTHTLNFISQKSYKYFIKIVTKGQIIL